MLEKIKDLSDKWSYFKTVHMSSHTHWDLWEHSEQDTQSKCQGFCKGAEGKVSPKWEGKKKVENGGEDLQNICEIADTSLIEK